MTSDNNTPCLIVQIIYLSFLFFSLDSFNKSRDRQRYYTQIMHVVLYSMLNFHRTFHPKCKILCNSIILNASFVLNILIQKIFYANIFSSEINLIFLTILLCMHIDHSDDMKFEIRNLKTCCGFLRICFS